jgi:hypothetical protein
VVAATRELKRLINVHRLVKIVLQQPGSWSDRQPAGVVADHLRDVAGPGRRGISYADLHPDAADCLGPVAATANGSDPELAELLRARDKADVLRAADLAEQGELRLAADVCHLVRLGVPPPASGSSGDAPGVSVTSPGPDSTAQSTWPAPPPAPGPGSADPGAGADTRRGGRGALASASWI